MTAPAQVRTTVSDWRAALGTLALLVVLFFVAIWPLQPPPAVPASAPPGQFSAERAIAQLRQFAEITHPTGSAENAHAREFLLGQLRALGLNPEIQAAGVLRADSKYEGRVVVGATVHNLVARLPGTANTRPLMLVAHYDSVPSGPGASDDGSGTVTLLETARALRSGPPLKNDVIFLMTDGEEPGLLGAQAFVNENPAAKESPVTLNFEARGACGPSNMFETSDGNGWLIAQFAKASPYPVASSLSYEIYKRLPNDTDLTVFKSAGFAGLNFAYAGCFARYHTLGDRVANLDPRSLQHDGSYALALARSLGNADLSQPKAPDAVYFTLWRTVVHYPKSWTPACFLAVGLLFVLAVGLGVRRRRLSWAGAAAGFGGWFLAAMIAAGVVEGAWKLLSPTRFVSTLPYGMAYNGGWYAWAAVALTVAIVAGVFGLLFRWFNTESLALGALLWWLMAAGVASFEAAGASYLFLWPLAACLAELAYLFGRTPQSANVAKTVEVGGSALAWTFPAAAGVLIAGALPYMLIMLLSTLIIAPLSVVTAFTAALFIPCFHVMARPGRWYFPAAALGAALVLAGAGIATHSFSAAKPRADSLFYTLDADSGRANWASMGTAPDAWTRPYLASPLSTGTLGELGLGSAPLIASQAPKIDIAPPALTVLENTDTGSGRRRLAIHLEFAANTRLVWMTAEKARVFSVALRGQPPQTTAAPRESKPGTNPWLMAYMAPPPEGLTLSIEVEGSPVFRVFENLEGLPTLAGFASSPRPADLMPTPWCPPLDSSTVVMRSFPAINGNMVGEAQGP